MQVGFTHAEATDMFNGLKGQVFDYFDYHHPLSFGIRPSDYGIFNDGAIAHCNFSDDPDQPYMPGVTRITEYAGGIRMKAEYLPHLYEDELMHILLHELVHAVLPLRVQHGRMWRHAIEEVGGIPLDYFLIRNWEAVVGDDADARLMNKIYGATADTYTRYPVRRRNEIVYNMTFSGWF